MREIFGWWFQGHGAQDESAVSVPSIAGDLKSWSVDMNIAPRRMIGDAVRAPTRSPVWVVKRASMAQLSVIFDPVAGAPGKHLDLHKREHVT